MLRRGSTQVDDILKQTSQLCILFDPSVIDGPEDYMPDESLVFFHPSSVPMSRQRSITGHLHAISYMISDIRPTAKPFIFTFLHCIVCVVAVDKFLLALSAPLTMPHHALIAQIKLLVDAIFFFSGPLSAFQPRPDDPHNSFNVHINKLLEFMVRHLMSERLSVMRSSLGYTQSKFNIPTEYLLRTASTIESLPGVSGGLVLHKGKLVFSSLPNNLTSLLLTIDSLAVPAEPINTDKGNKMEVFIVYIPLETWGRISYPSDDIEVSSAADLLNGVEFGDDVESVGTVDSSQEGGDEGEEGTFEFVEEDIPMLPETILMPSHSTSHSIFRSISQTQGKFSLKSELFEGSKPVSPLTHYGNNRHARKRSSLSSLSSIKSSPSIKALVDNVFYDSLNSPEFNRYHHPAQGDPLIQSRTLTQSSEFLDVSVCPSGNSLGYKLQSEQDLDQAQSISQSSEQTQESVFLDAINDGCEEALGVLKKWGWIEHIDLMQYTEAELAVQHTADTTLLLIGTNLASNTTELWNTSIVLLGDISAAINTESIKVMKKFTAGINSFVYNRVTGLFSHNISFNSTKESQNDISFCKAMLEDDSEVTMVCAGNSSGSVTGYRTSSNEVYQTSKDFSLGRLCDGMEETVARNFDTLHL